MIVVFQIEIEAFLTCVTCKGSIRHTIQTRVQADRKTGTFTGVPNADRSQWYGLLRQL